MYIHIAKYDMESTLYSVEKGTNWGKYACIQVRIITTALETRL